MREQQSIQYPAWYEEIALLRAKLHAAPELGHCEVMTTQLIKERLRAYGVEVLPFDLPTGVVGRLRGAKPGKILAIREDIDALPLQEDTGLPYASTVAGVSHACGHDIHAAALLGCAKQLAQQREALQGTVLFVFQCAEETFDGASTMLSKGIFQDESPDALVGFHCAPALPLGKIGLFSGVANASCDVITIRVIGKGGHGAHPDDCIDPIVTAAGLLMQLQTIVSRRNKATHPLVLTFGEFHGGSAPNIIPDEVLLRGTMRCIDNAFRLKRLEEIRTLCHSFCQSMGAQCEVVVEKGMPPLENAEDICTQLAESSRKVLGADCVVQDLTPSMGSDDFSCMLEACKNHGAQYLLGTHLASLPQSGLGLHVAQCIFPSEALCPGVETLTQFALDYLK